jgi:hypothetical protein
MSLRVSISRHSSYAASSRRNRQGASPGVAQCSTARTGATMIVIEHEIAFAK